MAWGGGSALSRLLPHLAQGSTVYAYGVLAGAEPVSVPSTLIMGRDLTLKRFSNFMSRTVGEPGRLEQALRELEAIGADPLLLTRVGRTFAFEEVGAAMAYKGGDGARAVLLP